MDNVRKLLGLLVNFVIIIPFVLLLVLGVSFGLEYFAAMPSSHTRNVVIAAFGTAILIRVVPKEPGRAAIILAALAYAVIAVLFWKFG